MRWINLLNNLHDLKWSDVKIINATIYFITDNTEQAISIVRRFDFTVIYQGELAVDSFFFLR